MPRQFHEYHWTSRNAPKPQPKPPAPEPEAYTPPEGRNPDVLQCYYCGDKSSGFIGWLGGGGEGLRQLSSLV